MCPRRPSRSRRGRRTTAVRFEERARARRPGRRAHGHRARRRPADGCRRSARRRGARRAVAWRSSIGCVDARESTTRRTPVARARSQTAAGSAISGVLQMGRASQEHRGSRSWIDALQHGHRKKPPNLAKRRGRRLATHQGVAAWKGRAPPLHYTGFLAAILPGLGPAWDLARRPRAAASRAPDAAAAA